MKIKHAIYILLLCFTILPLLLFGSFMICVNNQNLQSTMEENLEVISGAQILDIENFCEVRKENMEEIAKWFLVQNAVDASLDRGTFSAMELMYLENALENRCDIYNFSESLTVINKNFEIVASSKPYEQGMISELKNGKEKYLYGNFRLSNIIVPNERGNENKIVVAVSGIYSGEELTGYIVEEISLNFFDSIRTESNLWTDGRGTLYLLDGKQQVITAGDGIEESRQEFVLEKSEREDYNNKRAMIDFDSQPRGYFSYKVMNEKYITYYSDIKYTDWQMLLSVNLSRYQEKKTAYICMVIVIGIAAASLFAILNYFFVGKADKACSENYRDAAESAGNAGLCIKGRV